MKLTSGQKNALYNKVAQIIEQKKKEDIENFKKTWKPDKETEEYLAKVKKVIDLKESLLKAVEEAGFQMNYGYISTYRNHTLSLSLSNDDTYNEVIDRVRETDAEEAFSDKYPTAMDINDELELLSLSKDFNVDAFLDKYRNL